MYSTNSDPHLMREISSAIVLAAIVMVFPTVTTAGVTCSLEYNLEADLPIGKFPPDNVENSDFMLLAWNHFLALNAPEVNGQVNLAGDNETQWRQWSSTADLVNQADPGPSGSRFYPDECKDIPDYQNYRVLQQAGKVDDSFLEAQVRGLSEHPVLDSAGNFLRYEILLSPAMYNDVINNQWDKAPVLAAADDNLVFSCGFEEYDGGDPADPRMGAIVLKVAWREASGVDEAAGNGLYHRENLLVYNPNWRNSDGSASCDLKEMAMVGMHIAHKTEKQPNWIWMTFEHRRNAQDCTRQPTGGEQQPPPANPEGCPINLPDGEWSLAPGNCENDPKCAACNKPPAPNGIGLCGNPFVNPTGDEDAWCLDLPPNPAGGYTHACKQVPVSTYGFCSDDQLQCLSLLDCNEPATCEPNYAGVAQQNQACRSALITSPTEESNWNWYELISAHWTTHNGQDNNTAEQRCQNFQANISPTPTGPINKDIIREMVVLENGKQRPILGNTSMETYDRANCLACHARSYLNGVCSNDTTKVCSDKDDCEAKAPCDGQHSTDTMYFLKLEVAQPPALRFHETQLRHYLFEPGPHDDMVTVEFQSDHVVAGFVGSKDDPRCLDLPAGSVKAWLHFLRDGQELERGTIDLPCNNWAMDGSDEKGPTYVYSDEAGSDGPCSSLILDDGSAISAVCNGESIPEGLIGEAEDSPLQVMLVTGNRRYCTELVATGDDAPSGEEGLSMLESVLLPTVCPDLYTAVFVPSPSAASQAVCVIVTLSVLYRRRSRGGAGSLRRTRLDSQGIEGSSSAGGIKSAA